MADISSSPLITTPPPIERIGQQPYGQNRKQKDKEDEEKRNSPQDKVAITSAAISEKTDGAEKKETPTDGKGVKVDIVI
jgi:hypothetical protein